MGQRTEELLSSEWIEDIKDKLYQKMLFNVKKAEGLQIPYTVEQGEWVCPGKHSWTNGFWGATLWQMYLMTNDSYFRDEAVIAEKKMDAALYDFKGLYHDVGFMWLIQSGVRYELEKNIDSFDRTYFCALILASRFNPHGFIRAWNGNNREGWAIIDTMMNLPLLFWASRQTGDSRFRLIALEHADTCMKYFVRADGSCNHIVIFDAETGAYLSNPAGQGYASGSCWSRGEAWAIYGFALCYRMTGNEAYLLTSCKIAEHFIKSVAKTEWLPLCDFDAPAVPKIQDNAAASIAICGLLELSEFVSEDVKSKYMDAAQNILRELVKNCIDWSMDQPGFLTHCTEAYHSSKRHIRMTYADYFFIEAINRLSCKRKMLFWAPDLLNNG